MTSGFTIYTTSAFRRLSRSLQKHHQEFAQIEEEAFATLRSDPYNRSRRHQIKKLENVSPGKGQYRLRLGRWRFRFDIEGQDVVLYYCGLRREDTYEYGHTPLKAPHGTFVRRHNLCLLFKD